MATDHNFRIKNGLSVSGTEVIDSNLNIGAGGAANSSYDLTVYGLARFQGTANFVNSTAIQVSGQTVLDSSRNITINSRLTFGYNSHYFEAGTNSVSFKNSSGSSYITIANTGTTISGDLTLPDTASKIILDAYTTSQEGGGIFFREGFSNSNIYNHSILARSRSNDGSADGLSINAFEGVAFSTGSNSYNERLHVHTKIDSSVPYAINGTNVIDTARHLAVATGNVTGKFAVMSSNVHASYDFYNNGTSYFNNSVIIDALLNLTGTNAKLNIAGTTVIDANRNLTNIQSLTIDSGGQHSDTIEGQFFKWYHTGMGTQTDWYKVATVTISTGLYKALAMKVTVQSQAGNYGHTSNVVTTEYNVAYNRSGAVQDNANNATIHGQNAATHSLRVMKTATGTYELQIKQTSSYRDAIVHIEILSTNGGSIAIQDGFSVGSSSGTEYTPSRNAASENLFPGKVGGKRFEGAAETSNTVPIFTFDGDEDTGLGYISSNSPGFIAGGSRKFYVNSTNAYFQNLSNGLEVNGADFNVQGGNASNTRMVRILHTGMTGNQTILEQNTASIYGRLHTTERQLRIEAGSSGGTGTAEKLSFWTNASRAMTIDTSQRVGIGTSAPAYPFHVYSTEAKTVLIERGSASNAANLNEFSTHHALAILNRPGGSYLMFSGNSARTDIQATDGAGTATAKNIHLNPHGGNVGIGTGQAVPSNKLHVEGNTNGAVQIEVDNQNTGNASYAGLYLNGQGNNFFLKNWGDSVVGKSNSTEFLSTASGSNFIFSTANTERMRLTATGYLGIGTTSPAGNLHIKSIGDVGDAILIVEADNDNNAEGDNPRIELRQDGNNVAGYLYIEGTGGDTATSTTDNFTVLESKGTLNSQGIQFVTGGRAPAQSGGAANGSVKMTILGNGNVGIGSINPGHLLDVLKSGSGDATIRIRTTTGGDPTIIFNSAAANRSGLIKYQDNGTNVGRIEYVHNGDRIDLQAGSATGATMSVLNGKVGINTSTLTNAFHVDGNARIEGNLMAGGAAASNVPARPIHVKSAGDAAAIRIEDTTSSNLAYDLRSTFGTGLLFVDVTNGATRMTIKDSGAINFNGAYTFPTSDGSSGQVLQTDGSGNLSFATSSGGVTLSNGANNRIVTASSASAINGEANLQYDGSALDIYTGSIPVTDNHVGLTFRQTGTYSDGRYEHRFRKRDEGGGIPLYIDKTSSTANAHTAIVRFGSYTSNPEEFEVYGQAKITGNLQLSAGLLKFTTNNHILTTHNGNNIELRSGTTGSMGILGRNSNADFRFQVYGDGSSYGFLDGAWAGWDIKKTINGQLQIDEGSGLNKVWTSGNDGAGSGLDADTIDGLSFIEHQGVSKQISITVNGASDKYYPVVISGLNHEAGHEVKIERGYAETGPNDWYTSTHKGGLSLRVTIAGASGWGGYPNIYTVDEFGEIYSRICGGMKYTAHTMKFLVWLRGGTAAYRIFTKAANASVVVYDDTSSGYTSGSGWLVYDHSNSSYDVYEDLRDQTAADTGAKNEIIAKMPVRAGGTTKANQVNYYAGGTTLSGGNLYWNDANDGSGSGLDADTLDSVQASGFLRSNTSDTFTSGTLTFGSGTSFDTATNDVYPSMRVIRNNKSGSDGMYLGYANSNSGATRIYGGGATSGGIRVQGSGNNDIIMGSSSGTAWHSANDGANSGLDADLLDGQHGSYYRNASNINAGTLSSGRMPSTPPNTYIYGTDTLGAFDSTTFAVNPPRMGFFNINNSSAENPAGFGYWQGLHFRHNNQSSTWGWQLAGTYNSSYPDLYFRQVASASRGSWYKIWSTNNDGSGSGLDADTVDGVQAGDLARISTSNVFGSPNFNISNYFRRNNTSNYTNAPLLVESYGGAGSVTGVGFHISGQVGRFLYMSDSGVLYWNDSSSKIWHASNDGSGSGLDADTLDSYHASYFTPKDHIRSLGTTAFTSGSNPNITTAQYISEMESDGAFDSYSSVFKTSWSYAGNYNLSDAGSFGPTETAGMSHITWTDNSNDSARGNITVLAIAPTTGGSAGGVYVYNDQGSGYAPGWREIWTSSTDGAGSGLDADLLDGQHASAFLTSVPNHSANLITSGTVSAARLPSPLSSLHSDAVTGSALATTGSPHSVLEYQQASSISDTKLAPSGDWHNTIRMGHGNPYSYYSNTIALRMTGSGLGDLYTQTISNNNAQGWNKHWHTNNDGSGSGLDADLLDGQHASAFLTDGSIYLRSNASDTFGSTSSNQYIRFNCNSGQYIASGGSSSRFPIEIFSPTANGGDAGITFHISNDYAGFFGLASDWNDLAWGGWSVGSSTKYRIAHTGNFSSTGIWYNGNDGSGSGLDADTLDGQHGSYYEPASTNLYKHRGSVNVTSSSGGSNSNPFDDAHTETRVAENGSRLIHYTGASASMFSINVGGSASVFQIGAHYDGNNFYMRTRTDSSNWQTWKKLWHNGNDGSGSGLDADRLDGLDSGSFLRSDTNDTATGHITLGASTKIIFGNNSSYGIGAQGHNYRSGYFDTLESGGATDPLELIYYVGNKVNIGPGGNKPMNAGSYQVNGTEIVTSARALTNITGITTTGALNMSNQQIYGVNNLRFNDPGVQEGIKWDGGNQWQIYESPNNQTNASGNLQFTSGSGNGTIRMTLDTSGNVTATGDVTAFSDERLKTNIQTLDGKKALQMRGVSFEKNGEQGSGVIAQELEKIAPELVHTSDDDMQTKSVAYGNLVGYLIEAIKDQQKQIDELKEKLNI